MGNGLVIVVFVYVALLTGGGWSQTVQAPRQPRTAVEDAMQAEAISREEYGIVLKPGRLMSTANVTHLIRGFEIKIPRVQNQA